MIFQKKIKKKISKNAEKEFHDKWAQLENPETINIKLLNEASTAPEMRHISYIIGNIKNKKILDLGCGLGEASIYFATKLAKVTALDLSPGMLKLTNKLAQINKVKIKTHLATAENFKLKKNNKFDIIYAGNCLHHSNIKETLKSISFHLKKDGIFVSWDPIAYNPIINIYRKLACKVRTIDEHPLTIGDINLIKKNFKNVKTKYFWLLTLLIFIFMYIFQNRDPNKERYWKAIIYEEKKWQWIYLPLEFIDKILLFLFPPLKLFCWNVVIYGVKK